MSSECVEWSTMIEDVKKYIVGLLDYESRCNLRTCSKSDLALVDSTPFMAGEISIVELGSEMDIEKTTIRLKIDSFTIWFIGKNDVTKVDRAWKDGELLEWDGRKEENRYEVMRRHVTRFLPNGLFSAKHISLSFLSIGPMDGWNLRCDSLQLNELSSNLTDLWLSKVVSTLSSLELWSQNCSLTPEILKTSRSLRVNAQTEMTDEQLDRVGPVDFVVHSDRISWQAVNRFIAKFLKLGKKSDDVHFGIQLPLGFDFFRLIPQNVDYRSVDSGFEFKVKLLGGFQNEHGVKGNRELYAFRTGSNDGLDVIIVCRVCLPTKKSEFSDPCVLWPFTPHH